MWHQFFTYLRLSNKLHCCIPEVKSIQQRSPDKDYSIQYKLMRRSYRELIVLQWTNFLRSLWESISYKKCLMQLKKDWKSESFKYLENKKFQTFLFPIIHCCVTRLKMFHSTNLHCHWSVFNEQRLFQGFVMDFKRFIQF